MKKKIRWKLLGSLRVHHCALTAPLQAILSHTNALCFAILLLFSLAIFNVDAKSDQDVEYANDSIDVPLSKAELEDILNVHKVFASEQLMPRTYKKLFPINCRNLQIGQFQCPPPEIDLETQQPKGCSQYNLAPINCTLRAGLICDDDNEVHTGASTDSKRYVTLAVGCQYTNGYSHEITLLLSIFLGMFGADRFYLGYPAIGLLKLCTLGFLFLGQFIDIILIAMQIVKPADGSNYVIKYMGPRLTIIKEPGVPNMLPANILNAKFVTDSAFENFYYLPNNYTLP